jgi:hypothetical protein
MQSRLQAMKDIIPVTWSARIGAVVGCQRPGDKVHTVYHAQKGKIMKRIFISDTNPHYHTLTVISTNIIPLIQRLKERYGKDFEGEFCLDHKEDKIYMVQIRPLTNLSDIEVKFPNKESILTSEFCMGAGEYIGRIVMPKDVVSFQLPKDVVSCKLLPEHYTFAIDKLDQTIPKEFGAFSCKNGNVIDYDKSTPDKKVLIVTGKESRPGMHALTIANERGIICLAGGGRELSDEEFEREMYHPRNILEMMGLNVYITAHLLTPRFDVQYQTVGEFVHVVCDGLVGKVYQATEKEAEEFQRKLYSSIRYHVTPIISPAEEQSFSFWNLKFNVSAIGNLAPYRIICRAFIEHMQQITQRQFSLRISPEENKYAMIVDGAEFEVYCAFFDPRDKTKGIDFSTGRSASEIADKETTRIWFQTFADRIKNEGYVPK